MASTIAQSSVSRHSGHQTESPREHLRNVLRNIAGLAWVFAGDSLRGPSDGTREWRNSPERLLEYLQGKLYRTNDVVIDRTSFGGTISSLRQELPERILRFQPDLVVVCIGPHEARAGIKGLELFEHQLAVVIEEALDAKAIPVVCTPPAIKADTTVDQLVYVEAIRATAAEYDVPLVDHWEHWEQMATQTDLDDWSDDPAGLPGRQGHVELVRKLVKDLELRRDRRGTTPRPR